MFGSWFDRTAAGLEIAVGPDAVTIYYKDREKVTTQAEASGTKGRPTKAL
ncbi:MAG: hypothetical protein JXB47_02965 [Anaerolineae bacterium]|nr:hypothetical protein [Anaerolineae bacterium]